MKLPKKGEIVSLEEIKELCMYFELFSLWDKIAENPPPKPFKSDGCSGGFPDVWKNAKGRKVSIYEACLKHDIVYWCGREGEHLNRFFADVDLMVDVVRKTGRIKLGLAMFAGVRAGGGSWTKMPFRWGFGR